MIGLIHKMKNKILIVVTFFYRTQTLKALENYYYDKNVSIVFVDQSYEQVVKNTRLKNVIDILHFPADKINFYQMWIKLVEKYKQEFNYFVWNNDDDFTIAESLNEIQKFINTDHGSKFSLVTGQVYQIDSKFKHIKNYSTFEYHKDEIISNNPKTRLQQTFTRNGVHVNPHAVIKAEVFKECCTTIMSTYQKNNSILPIKFFDKIITAYASLMGYRKTNFNNVTSVRTARSFTGSLTKRPNFPVSLEKNVKYEKIIKRLKNNNVIAKKFNINEKFLMNCIQPDNIVDGIYDSNKTIPSDKLDQKNRINEIINALTLSIG